MNPLERSREPSASLPPICFEDGYRMATSNAWNPPERFREPPASLPPVRFEDGNVERLEAA